MDLSTKLLGVTMLVGLLLSFVITFQHFAYGPHMAYDNWLLPVFLAILLQFLNGMK